MNNHRLLLLTAFVIGHSVFDVQAAPPPPELTVLRQQYEKIFAERVTAVHEANVATLDAKFTTALDNAIATAKSAGDLPTVLAIQGDKKLLADKQPLPADDDATPEPLKKLRAIYRDQLGKLTEQRTANTTALLTPYAAKLQALEATLTKNDRVDEAKEVMDYRVGLKADAPAAPAVAATTPAAPGTTPPMPANTVPQVKGDDRKAAEWVLSVGGIVRLWENTNAITVSKPEDLPKGSFSIRSITLDNNNGVIKPFTDADFAVLAGLEKLADIALQKLAITPAALDTLGTCPFLFQVGMQYNAFGDDAWQHLAGVRNLTKLYQSYDKLPVTGIGLSRLSRETLAELSLSSSPISDQALVEIATFPQITTLVLEVTQITDEGIKHLAQLKKLEKLNVRNTDVTPAGLIPLKGQMLTLLGYGRTLQETAGGAAEVSVLFPKLEALALPRDCNPTPADCAALSNAWPKLKRLSFNSRKVDDTGCAAVAAMSSLEEIDFMYCPITDVGVASLAQMKKLTWLAIPDAKLTDAALDTLAKMKVLKTLKLPKPANGLTAEGIAKFKKQRPDVKLN
jgi:hypothetical protein